MMTVLPSLLLLMPHQKNLDHWCSTGGPDPRWAKTATMQIYAKRLRIGSPDASLDERWVLGMKRLKTPDLDQLFIFLFGEVCYPGLYLNITNFFIHISYNRLPPRFKKGGGQHCKSAAAINLVCLAFIEYNIFFPMCVMRMQYSPVHFLSLDLWNVLIGLYWFIGLVHIKKS